MLRSRNGSYVVPRQYRRADAADANENVCVVGSTIIRICSRKFKPISSASSAAVPLPLQSARMDIGRTSGVGCMKKGKLPRDSFGAVSSSPLQLRMGMAMGGPEGECKGDSPKANRTEEKKETAPAAARYSYLPLNRGYK